MATIKAIEARSIHQIQSGQVIVDLNSVTKELVENALDAGATSIEVRFRNQGLDAIEVQDNGKGISPDDFETVALKHHTSKLSDYEDLSSLDTFGFRGEALSSLCALSKFHILTARAEDGAVGRKLDFEVSGRLKSTSVQAAQKGTTVSAEDIFYNLPVRRKELEKNVKREYGKVIGLLYQYACISVGVRFTVSNQMPKSKKVSVFSTNTNPSTKENITNVFGAKTLLALVKLDLNLQMSPQNGPSTQNARKWSTQANDRSMEVCVEGHISKPVFGEGRNAPDRQMFFVNSRPCALPQVSKAFNEVYKSFNVSQSPFIFANLRMDTNAYDVNVSPDKRTIMLHDQVALLESLKLALTELFEQTDQTMPQSTLPQRKLPEYKPLSVPRRGSRIDENEKQAEESENKPSKFSPNLEESSQSSPPDSPLDLIHDWIGRDCEPRKELSKSKLQNRTANIEKTHHADVLEKTAGDLGVSDVLGRSDEQSNVDDDVITEAFDKAAGAINPDILQARRAAKPNDAVQDPDPLSTPYDDLFAQRPPHIPHRPWSPSPEIQPVTVSAVGGYPTSQVSTEYEPMSEDQLTNTNPVRNIQMEPPIPIIMPGSQKSTPGPVQNAFDRMRPKRTPLQTAEITVGDVTTRTLIGSSPPYKRRRVYDPKDSQAVTKYGGSPLLARGLRKNFAAPGSQLQIDSSNLPTADLRAVMSQSSDISEESESGEDDQAVGSVDQRPSASESAPDLRNSNPLSELEPAPVDEDQWDEDYIDETEKRTREDEKIARLIQEAEDATARPTNENLRRASQALKNGGNRTGSTLQMACNVRTSVSQINRQLACLNSSHLGSIEQLEQAASNEVIKDEIDDIEAESRLSLTVTKADFERMEIVGQFNLGFVLAVRPGRGSNDQDDLFIIDQHAADEKYNYERLQRTVTIQSQRLVRPKQLELTAVEEEILLNHSDALKANGFEVEATYSSTADAAGRRTCRLLTLPMSKEKTFELSDLEELLHLLSEAPAGSTEIPRPKKVQKMLAMRACRSSIMVGKTLTPKQLQRVVRHMGEMEKPWNCPHGRPTMRHLAGLSAWSGWREGDAIAEDEEMAGRNTDWAAWLEKTQ